MVRCWRPGWACSVVPEHLCRVQPAPPEAFGWGRRCLISPRVLKANIDAAFERMLAFSPTHRVRVIEQLSVITLLGAIRHAAEVVSLT